MKEKKEAKKFLYCILYNDGDRDVRHIVSNNDSTVIKDFQELYKKETGNPITQREILEFWSVRYPSDSKMKQYETRLFI